MSVPVEVLVSTRVKDSHDGGRRHLDAWPRDERVASASTPMDGPFVRLS